MSDRHDRDNRPWLIAALILAFALVALFALSCGGEGDSGGSRDDLGATDNRGDGSAGDVGPRDRASGAGSSRRLDDSTSVPTPTPTAEPVTPLPTLELLEPTLELSPKTPVPVPTQAPAAPVFAGSSEQWRQLVASIFPSWAVDTALRIIQCESKGNPGATGGHGERGLFQIHPVHPDSTYDPAGNVQAAYRISAGGQDWSAWTCR